MTAVPCQQIVHAVEGGDGDVKGVFHRFGRDHSSGDEPPDKLVRFVGDLQDRNALQFG